MRCAKPHRVWFRKDKHVLYLYVSRNSGLYSMIMHGSDWQSAGGCTSHRCIVTEEEGGDSCNGCEPVSVRAVGDRKGAPPMGKMNGWKPVW